MLKRFTDYKAALDYGRAFGTAGGCRAYCATVFDPDTKTSVYFVAGPSSVARLHGVRGSDFAPWSGWYFGGSSVLSTSEAGTKLMAEPDRDALPGRGEYFYEMAAGHTSGFSHDQLVAIATEVEANKSCVWHEAARVSNSLATCHCGKCRPNPKRTSPKPAFYRGPV